MWRLRTGFCHSLYIAIHILLNVGNETRFEHFWDFIFREKIVAIVFLKLISIGLMLFPTIVKAIFPFCFIVDMNMYLN